MLSESVLKDLASPTPLREHLVKTAWSSLSTEAKLQLIDAHRADQSPPFHYLYELAASDPHPIVRYWGLRQSYLPNPDQPETWHNPSELEAARRARSDPCPLVRACYEKAQATNAIGIRLEELSSHTARLVAIRTEDSLYFHNFVKFLKTAVDAGTIPAVELGECMHEYAHGPAFRKFDADERTDDWYWEMSCDEALETVWELASRTELPLAAQIAMYAPLRVSGSDVGVLQLAKLRGTAIEWVLCRAEEPASRALREYVLAHPDQFDEDCVRTAQYAAERRRYSAEEVREYRIKHSATDAERMPLLLEALRADLREARNELAQLREQAVARVAEPTPEPTRKRRSLFG
ncbi:MAG TPA: hypothetical protein PKV98_05910 [Burkholderiaceae bacterium]|nr:hypothetical protein [Burkholderiaceae bacterium]